MASPLAVLRFIGRQLHRLRFVLLTTVVIAAGVTLFVTRPLVLPPSGESLGRLEADPKEPIAGRDGRVSVLFLGDTHFGESYAPDPAQSVVAQRGYAQPSGRLRMLAQSAEVTIANLETPLTTQRSSPLRHLKNLVHWGEPEPSAATLSQLGIDAVSLGNNHAYDALGRGLDETLAVLDHHRIAAFGAGRDLSEAARPLQLRLRLGDRILRLAVIGGFEPRFKYLRYSAYATSTGGGTYALNARTLRGQIRALKEADPNLFVVVFPHWGKNYRWRSPEQTQLAHAMLEAGADLVIGHGAHLFQEIELLPPRMVLYSLGNFVFLTPGRFQSLHMHPTSTACRLEFHEEAGEVALDVVLYFLASDNRVTGYQPYVLHGAEFDSAVRQLLDGGSLPPEARDRLRAAAKRDRDRVGPHLRLPLGRVRG